MKTLIKAAAIALAALAMAAPAHAQKAEKPTLTLGVGGKPLLYYLPLTIAERNGYFKEEGLDVTINDFGGGAKSLQALIGGSIDVVTGAYEHTIRMQAKGQDIVATIELGRFPGIVLVVKKDKADQYKSIKDLKGAKIGVTAPGSSTNFFVNYLLAKNGLSPDDVSFVGGGGGASAVAQMKRGEIDAMANLDPVITKLENDGDVVVLADSRTEAGTKAIFGGSNPAAVLYIKQDFIQKNPQTVQALVDAFHHALLFLAKATPEDVAATVPESYYLGDKPLYNPQWAAERVKEHAAHFVGLVEQLLTDYQLASGSPGVISSNYDTELFGHWWFEGVDWLKEVLRGLAASPKVELTTASAIVEKYPPQTVIELPEGSWGAGGGHFTWLNVDTQWMWPIIHQAEIRMEGLVETYPSATGDLRELLNQAAREVLLLESSDWPFLITTGQAKEYASERFMEHVERFTKLAELAEAGGAVSEETRQYLTNVEGLDNPFPGIDYRIFAPRQGSAAVVELASAQAD
jgi:NitT/TauT family transport system substrate-binding protein